MPDRPPIHIVDDDEAARESLSFLLGAAGHAVKTFDSAGAFLEALAGMAVSCVVTDIRMPGIDGLELMRRLTAEGHRFPVIMITGHGDIHLAVEAMKLGAFDFLEKPFDDDTMIAAINAALHRVETDIESKRESSEIAERLHGLIAARTTSAGRVGRRTTQQGDRPRSRHQSPDGRDLPRQGHGQDEGLQSFGPRSPRRPGRNRMT